VDYEIIIADASDVPAAVPDDSRIRVLPERPRLGCTKGYNRACREAQGEWLLWLNDDCEVLADFDIQAIRFMEAHVDVGLGALYYSEPPHLSKFQISEAWGLPYANFGILRRDLGNDLGWFDEEFAMYGMDNSLSFKVMFHGLGVEGIPDARLIHHSENDVERRKNQSGRPAAARTLHRKYWTQVQTWKKRCAKS
jgi:GT2 family glycosyltransferase